MKQYNLEDMEINIKDWFCTVCLKWRSIIVMMLLFAILASGYSYIKPQLEKNESIEISSDVIRLKNYYDLQKSQQQYMQESPLMQMDETKVSCLTLKYFVSLESGEDGNTYQSVNKVNALVEAYKNAIADTELQQKIAEQTNGILASEFVWELISAEDGKESGIIAVQNKDGSVLSTQSLDVVLPKQDSLSASGIFTVTIKGFDDSFCRMAADCVQEKIPGATSELTKKVGKHTIQLISSSMEEIYDSELLTKRFDLLSKAQTVDTNIKTIENALTDEEKTYAEKVLSGEVDTKADNVIRQDEAETFSEPSISLKFLIIGLLVGAFLAVGFWSLIYIMSGKLHMADDLESMWGVKTYTRKPAEKKLFCVDKLIYEIKNKGVHLFKDEELIDVLKAEIQILAEKQGLKRFFATGTELSESDKQLMEKLQAALAGTDLSLTVGSNAVYNPASMALLADADAVILLEQIGESSYAEICRELQQCAEKDIPVMGCVVSGF